MPRAIRAKKEGDPKAFRALADPTRRQILRVLGAGEMRASDVAARFDISRPGVAKHLKVLLEAKLVAVEQRGRERYYSIVPGTLRDAAARVHELDAFWGDALKRLGERLR